jgi:hypothetical protein
MFVIKIKHYKNAGNSAIPFMNIINNMQMKMKKLLYQCFLLQPQALLKLGSLGLNYFCWHKCGDLLNGERLFYIRNFYVFLFNPFSACCFLALLFFPFAFIFTIDYCLSSSSSIIGPISVSTIFPLIQ